MAVVGTLLNNVVRAKGANFKRKLLIGQEVQEQTLRKLITRARNTQFGKAYGFDELLLSPDFVKDFQNQVPIYNYEKLYTEWWHKLLQGDQKNVCWPGKVKYFGLTSGTSNDSSKRVPLTTDMIRSMRKTGIRQLLALSEYDMPPKFYEKSVLMLGGSTSLNKIQNYFEGDLSGIMAGRLPFWFDRFYKPGKPIAKVKDWTTKINKMVEQAPNWDIGGISGVPAWVQILIEKIIERYNLKHIHEIWPNFMVYAHGGVALDPYKKSFNKLLGHPIIYLETYLASEGFLAYQREKDTDMQLVLDNGIFFEFIPFDEENFTQEGQMVEHPKALLLSEVEENRDYAILISTCAGAWRYLIGDTIRFSNKSRAEFVITGRTKHFLSLCGEHLSVDNMLRGIQIVSEEMGIDIKEFTVQGIGYEGLFAHKWYLGIDNTDVDKTEIRQRLDNALKMLNDDYAVERQAALKEVLVEVIPNQVFYDFMKSKGKEGGQHKFPRVIGKLSDDWETFLSSR
jgi:hypothetical protein